MMNCKLIKTENAWSKRLFQFIVVCLLLSVAAYESYAQENSSRKGFILGTSLGYGALKYEYKGISTSEETFALGLHAGYAITPKIIAGLEANGWTIEAFNNTGFCYNYCYYDDEPSRGESISNVSMFLNVFPFDNSPFYITGGLGKVYYNKYDRYENYEDEGAAWFLGCGYELPVTRTVTYAPQFRYGKGNLHHGDYSVAEFSIALRLFLN
jgi:hypothetical protein